MTDDHKISHQIHILYSVRDTSFPTYVKSLAANTASHALNMPLTPDRKAK